METENARRREGVNPAPDPNRAPSPLPWRTGKSVHRTLYDANDRLIGVMDRPEDAALVVRAVNATGGKPAPRDMDWHLEPDEVKP